MNKGDIIYISAMIFTTGYSTFIKTRYPKSYNGLQPTIDGILWPGFLPLLIGNHLAIKFGKK